MALVIHFNIDVCHSQSFRYDVLYSFTNGPANPVSVIQGTDGNFYGTTTGGGWGNGTVFKLTPAGTLTVLYLFKGAADGAGPLGGLIQAPDGNFYGTTRNGGPNNLGTVFKITSDGSETTLYSFPGGTNGAYPEAALTFGGDGLLYGTTYGVIGSTYQGNDSDAGTVFRIETNGIVQTIYSFQGGEFTVYPNPEPDEGYPTAALTLGLDGNLYGTTTGASDTIETDNSGTIFKMTTNGVLTTLYYFSSQFDPRNDGSDPYGGLAIGPDGNFYGATLFNGADGYGTIFRYTTNGIFTVIQTNTAVTSTPLGKLYLGLDNKFYGASVSGGTGFGSIFRLTVFSTNSLFQTLYSFTGGADSEGPYAGLIRGTDGDLYGTTRGGGGGSPYGSIFKINGLQPVPSLTTIYSFTSAVFGARPQAGVLRGADGSLYGTTSIGGSFNSGTVFKLTTNGVLTTLLTFDNSTNGANPDSDLAWGPDGSLFGTAYGGGNAGKGTIFSVTTNGTHGFLYSLTNYQNPYGGLTLGSDGNFYGTEQQGGAGAAFVISTNGFFQDIRAFNASTEGASPYGRLALGADGAFYGTTFSGGPFGIYGTIFRITTNGVLTNLYSFTGGTDGSSSRAGLVQAKNGVLYGTAAGGGTVGGTIFSITTNGAFTLLHDFAGTDGSMPDAGLALGTDGNLYGSATTGGSNNFGTLFLMNTNGGLTSLFSFSGTNGAYPQGTLTLGTDGFFYGTTTSGGNGGGGVIFRLIVGGALNVTLNNGAPQVTVTGQAGNHYVLEYTDSLFPGNTWQGLWTNTLSASPQIFSDTSALFEPTRFYRIQLIP